MKHYQAIVNKMRSLSQKAGLHTSKTDQWGFCPRSIISCEGGHIWYEGAEGDHVTV